MKLIDSTYEILYYKVNNGLFDERLVIWAIDMLEAGFDSEHLRILAGADKPYFHFYLNDILEKILKELNIEITDREKITDNYLYYMISQAIFGKETPFTVLKIFKDLCVSSDYEKKLMDFYLLYWAKGDLEYDTVQWYWPDADRSNIDKVILDYFKEWKMKYEEKNQ